MVYTAKTGTPVTFKSSTNRLVTTSTLTTSLLSPKALLIAWLLHTLLPLALTAGLGSKDIITSGPSQYSLLRQKSSPPTHPGHHTTSNDNHYTCPTSCQCDYSSSSQKLDIRCSRSEIPPSSPSSTQKINLSPGVRTLHISDALLVDAKSVARVVPILRANLLIELDLQYVTLEPKALFSASPLLRESRASLRKLSIKSATLRNQGDFPLTDLSASSIRAVLQPLASLQSLDSLNICDSSPSLATVVLQAMPAVRHLTAVNNSLYEIPYESLTSNPSQYSVIESLDLSRNHLSVIPNGLLEGLTSLLSLDVSHNRIFHLQETVFTGLTHLRKLNISHNQIEYVDAEVFTPLRYIQTVDLSHNEVVQFFGPYFENNDRLTVLNLSNMWVAGTFAAIETATRSLMEVEKLINSLHRVERLDISENGMRAIPETLTHAPNLQHVIMDGNQWECSCQDRWFTDWVKTTNVKINDNQASRNNMWCYSTLIDSLAQAEIVRWPFDEYMQNLTIDCSSMNIVARTPYKFYAVMGHSTTLDCHSQKPNWPRITWITPSKKRYSESNLETQDIIPTIGDNNSSSNNNSTDNELLDPLKVPRVAADGSLLLTNVTGKDLGLYLCIASYQDLNITHYVHLGVDVSIFREVRIMSILVGWTFSFAFLLLVLLGQLVKFILSKLGVQCVTVKSTQQTRYVRAFFDSMEQHKTTQLDWLRDNYNMQAKKIKDNCYSQLERIRESYSNQSRNLGDIRDKGTQQLHTLRDQYNDQVRKVASYSAHRLCKVRENYVFKRNQVCKFSNHQMLRLRETYKWQAQTLNKILENLPRGLNFDTCRGMGACGRADSVYLDEFGEDFLCPLHNGSTTEADEYHQCSSSSSGHPHNLMAFAPISRSDKLEHVSLLISPDYVCEYKQRSAAEALGLDHPSVIQEEDEEAIIDAEDDASYYLPGPSTRTRRRSSSQRQSIVVEPEQLMALARGIEKIAIVGEEDAAELSSSTSTPATMTLESSGPSTRNGSYSSECGPSHPPKPLLERHREKTTNTTTM